MLFRSDEISSGYKFRQPVFVAEVDLNTLFQSNEQNVLYQPLPVFPSIQRDISLLVKRTVSLSEIKQTIENEGKTGNG